MSRTISLTCFFEKALFNTRTYIVSYVINFMASTSLYCPNLWVLPKACYSTPGFHHGSIKNILFATYKFKPTEPVFNVIMRATTLGSVLNYEILLCLSSNVLFPSIVTHWIPYFFNEKLMSVIIPRNDVKINALSLYFIYFI